ncbi:MAG: hypothetical protein IT494_05795 [Gammaproteobacteria bacterium]|nr:hypothetical protein [Gammaproteobacteria bacterium]
MNGYWLMVRAVTLALCALVALPAGAAETPITVLNPRGIQPPIRLVPMAARPASLDGKTIYIVDTKYPRTKPFVEELQQGLAAKYPRTNWVIKEKVGSYFDDDPKLWADAKVNAAGAIVLIGH